MKQQVVKWSEDKCPWADRSVHKWHKRNEATYNLFPHCKEAWVENNSKDI